ncbi:RDD family protein [Microlunatus lacustris]
MTDTRATPAPGAGDAYPGERLGLAPDGRGSLASWRSRIAALLVDWLFSMAAVALFGAAVSTSDDWRAAMVHLTFLVESAVLSWLTGGSLGQLVCRIGIIRLDRVPLGLPRAVLRAVLVSLTLPPLVVGADRRGLQDYAAGTVVVNRR